MKTLSRNESGYLYIWLIVGMTALQIVVMLAVGAADAAIGTSFKDSYGYQLLLMAATEFSFLGVVLIFLGKKKIPVSQTINYRRPIKPLQIILLTLTAAAAIFAFAPLAGLLVGLLRSVGYTYTPDFPDYVSTPLRYALGLVFLGVLPAFCEETAFRGAILSGLKSKGYVYAVLVSALLFSLMHLNATQLVHQFLIGILFAYAAIITRSIWAGITLHLVNNALAVSIDRFLPEFSFEYIYMVPAFIALALLLLLFSAYTLKAAERERGVRWRPQKGKRLASFMEFTSGAVDVPAYDSERPTGLNAAIIMIIVLWLFNFAMGFNI